MIWDIIEDKIENAGLAVSGRDMFRFTMPADIDVGVMLKSPLTGIAIDPYIPGYYQPVLQVIVRHTDPVIGEQLAYAVMDTLTVEKDEVFAANSERGQARIIRFYPRDLPIRFPRLEGKGIEWSLNFNTAFTFER
jgi:hypothetical protein